MPNPLNRGVLGGALTPVYIAGAESGSLAGASTGADGEIDSVTIDSIAVPTVVPLVGQATIAVAGTAVQLSANNIRLPGGIVLITCRHATTYVTIGGAGVPEVADGTGTGQTVAEGETAIVFAGIISQVWINGDAGDWVSWSAG